MQTQTTTPSGKAWRLEFLSGGCPFVWEGIAASEYEAKATALQDLADDWAGFTRATARLMVCIERPAA